MVLQDSSAAVDGTMPARIPLSEEVSEYLINGILSGRYAPGTFLPTERELCEGLQVSRTAVREAVKIVASKGLLLMVQGKGTMVNPNPLQALSAPIELAMRVEGTSYLELLDARLLIEREAARLAAERITPEELVALHETIEALRNRSAHPLPSSESWERDPDVMFHRMLVNAAHHSVLRILYWPLLVIWTRSLADLAAGAPEKLKVQPEAQTLAAHEHIYDALSERRAAAAARAVEVHLSEARRPQWWSDRLVDRGASGS